VCGADVDLRFGDDVQVGARHRPAASCCYLRCRHERLVQSDFFSRIKTEFDDGIVTAHTRARTHTRLSYSHAMVDNKKNESGDNNKLSSSISYDQPHIHQLLRSNAPASGNVILSISGVSLGAFELSPRVAIGNSDCSYSLWISDTMLHCLMPRAAFKSRFFEGSSESVQVAVQNVLVRLANAVTYDQACVGPCVGSLLCDERVGRSEAGVHARGCSGPTGGDFRHESNSRRRLFDLYEDVSVVRIHGNFTIGAERVLVGNSTKNNTVSVRESVNKGDIRVTFGEIYDCEVLTIDEASLEQYVDCKLPPGTGTDHKIFVTVRNVSYVALLEGCTARSTFFFL
jgi:hypothetical protein